jgi:hypothetical protein
MFSTTALVLSRLVIVPKPVAFKLFTSKLSTEIFSDTYKSPTILVSPITLREY